MKPALWLLLGLVIGGIVGWYVRGLAEQDVRASDKFSFNDKLADQPLPYLSATGSWRGTYLANEVNTVRILCIPSDNTCDLHQADVLSLYGRPRLSLNSTTFGIKRIDAESVVAEPSLPSTCIRQTLTFDRVSKAVTMVRSKISREDVCSFVQDEPLTLFLGEPLR